MKINTEDIGSSQVVLEIEVDPPRMERAIDQAYRRMAGRINVPGFRRGKAPRPLVEQMVGRASLLEDAIEHVVPEVYREAVRETGLHPIEEANFEVVDTDPLRVKATVPVRPTVQLGDYRSVRHELVVPAVTPDQVQGVLDNLRESHATWMPVERPVQGGDRVAMDVHMAAGETVLIDRQDIEYDVSVDSPRPLPGFGQNVIGMQAGEERHFTLRVPDDFEDESLRGQDAACRVEIRWVKEKHLPELDDAFASQVGTFGTMDEVRTQVESELQQRAEREAQRELQDAVVEAVVGVAQLELPPQAIEKQAQRLRARLASSLDNQGITVEQYLSLTGKAPADFDEELRTEARRDLTRAFVLDTIADAEGIEVGRAEVDLAIRQAGDGSRAALSRQDVRDRMEMLLRERKTVERLVELATGDGEASAEALTPATAGAEERPNG